jgi:hypothetical protein
VSEPQLHLHLEEATPAERQPLRTLDVAEADASECFWPGCEASPSFRVYHGAKWRDYCDGHVEQGAASKLGLLAYDELPPGF